MKKIITVIVSMLLIAVGIALASPILKQNDTIQGDFMDKKILIAYFSWSGNTKVIAEKIHSQTGGDVFEIIPQKPYPSDYHETTVLARKEKENNVHPELKNKIDISAYDIIFVGTPAWWYTMAPPVMTFLEENNFEGKTIVPFVTHGGGGGYSIASDMKKLASGAKVLTQFTVYGKGAMSVNQDISEWLNQLK